MMRNRALVMLTVLLAGSMVHMCSCSGSEVAVVPSPSPSIDTIQVHPDGTLDFKKDIDKPEFIPTNEWKDILPGQGIPVGIEVRINMSTGRKEGRLLQPEEGTATISAVAQNDDEATYVTDIEAIPDAQVRNMLKFLPAGEVEEIKKSKYTPAELKRAAQLLWEKRQRELQEVMDSTVTNADVTLQLLAKIKNETISVEDRVAALEELEYHVTDIDNSGDMVKMDGLLVLKSILEKTDVPLDVVSNAIWVIGTCVKHSPSLQSHASDMDIIELITNYLQRGVYQENFLKKGLYTISSLIGSHGSNQEKFFVEFHGNEILLDLFALPLDSNSVKLKVMSLVYDTLYPLSISSSTSSSEHALAKTMIDASPQWCNRVAGFVSSTRDLSHDALEKGLLTFETLSSLCRKEELVTMSSALSKLDVNTGGEFDEEIRGIVQRLSTRIETLL